MRRPPLRSGNPDTRAYQAVLLQIEKGDWRICCYWGAPRPGPCPAFCPLPCILSFYEPPSSIDPRSVCSILFWWCASYAHRRTFPGPMFSVPRLPAVWYPRSPILRLQISSLVTTALLRSHRLSGVWASMAEVSFVRLVLGWKREGCHTQRCSMAFEIRVMLGGRLRLWYRW
ncbi:hypothetical protein DFP72DRAFT_466851 [Ephemerocybe angulata]|uniref:Uncharacterized protein n=1 Tax=Ephemerocybe angulata TaxID=980116 RepID=A0A8H6M1B2_9AGAR|nr:hypothetical protein DFP72DRAFT_466851 [Tulosesus angulatus]